MAKQCTVRINVRMTDEDDTVLARILLDDGHSSVSAAIRMLIRQEAKRRGYVAMKSKPRKVKR